MRRLLPLLVLVACGKKPVDNAAIEWMTNTEAAEAKALAEKKPLFVYVGASWDSGAKELEDRTFPDPDVRAIAKRYVMLHLDGTDDEEPTYQRNAKRFRVLGTPALIVYAPDLKTELHRGSEFVRPQQLASILMYADASGGGLDGIRARASYDALRDVLRELRERALTHELMDPKRIPPWTDCYAKPKPEQPDCLRAETMRSDRMNAEHARFEHVVLPALLADSPVLSMNVRNGKGKESTDATAGPWTPEQKLGTRNVEVGIDLGDGTKLGWGSYRTIHRAPAATATRGDDALHSGIEVLYQTDSTSVKMIVLTDGFRRPRDWN